MKKHEKPQRLPSWLKTSKGKLSATKKLSSLLEKEVPNSICQEARCPNRSECFEKGVLTFMILGIMLMESGLPPKFFLINFLMNY